MRMSSRSARNSIARVREYSVAMVRSSTWSQSNRATEQPVVLPPCCPMMAMHWAIAHSPERLRHISRWSNCLHNSCSRIMAIRDALQFSPDAVSRVTWADTVAETLGSQVHDTQMGCWLDPRAARSAPSLSLIYARARGRVVMPRGGPPGTAADGGRPSCTDPPRKLHAIIWLYLSEGTYLYGAHDVCSAGDLCLRICLR